MSLGSSLSLLFPLLVFSITCDVVSIETMNAISNDSGIKHYFLTSITHGHGDHMDELDIFQLESSGHLCLRVNEKVRFLARYEHSQSQTLRLDVSYDSEEYKSYETFNEETKFKNQEKVCFLYGHFEPFSRESTVSIILYVRFISDETLFNKENFLRFTASRTPGRSKIEIRKIFGKMHAFKYKSIEVFNKDEANADEKA